MASNLGWKRLVPVLHRIYDAAAIAFHDLAVSNYIASLTHNGGHR